MRRLHPEAHGEADEHGPGGDEGDADVADGLGVVVGEAQPVEHGAYAEERHAVAVRPLRVLRQDQHHPEEQKQLINKRGTADLSPV